MAYGEMTWGLASKTGRHSLEAIQLPFNHAKKRTNKLNEFPRFN